MKTKVPPCRCSAYEFPHRRAGVCEWLAQMEDGDGYEERQLRDDDNRDRARDCNLTRRGL